MQTQKATRLSYTVETDPKGVKIVTVTYQDGSKRTYRPGQPGYRLALKMAVKS